MTRVRPRPLWAAAATVAVVLCAVLTAVPSSYAAFTARVTNPTNTAALNPYFTCSAAAAAGQAYYAYPLDDNPPANLAAARDVSGNARPGTYRTAASHSAANACVRDPGGSTTFNGTSNFVSTPNLMTSPQVFSTEVWFRTSTPNGALLGFSSSLLGLVPTSWDRMVYFAGDGRLVFGVYPGSYVTVATPAGTNYADGAWHHMVATLGPGGMVLYLDGRVAASSTNTAAASYNGYWRFAHNHLQGWPQVPSGNYYFSGQLGFAAVYNSQLSATVVAQHYVAGL